MSGSIEESAFLAVQKASQLCRTLQKKLPPSETITKSDKSPVTLADYSAQAIISHALELAFPDIPLVAEEDFHSLSTDETEQLIEKLLPLLPQLTSQEIRHAISRSVKDPKGAPAYWVLDPIDGTKGFLRHGQFAISLALIRQGTITHGILGCPNMGDNGLLFAATSMQGTSAYCLKSGQKMHTLVPLSEPTDVRLCESVEAGHTSHGWSSRVKSELGVEKESVRLDSQCKYAAVAQGDASVYLRLPTRKDYQEKVWDHAAGYLVLVESGGCVTDIHGKPLDFTKGYTLSENEGVIATRGVDHDRIVRSVLKCRDTL